MSETDEPRPEQDTTDEQAVVEDTDSAGPVSQSPVESGEEEVRLDVDAMPGGARSAIEAILMVVDQPVTELDLATALEVPTERVKEILQDLESEYEDQQRGFTLRRIDDGWRVYSRADYAPVVEKFLMGGQQAKLTQASLETLAVIAYRQPISRARVSAVRGVNVDGVVRTLLTRGLIVEAGNEEESTATLYCTTPYFLQRMGISSLDELPPLAPYLPDSDVIEELIEQGQA